MTDFQRLKTEISNSDHSDLKAEIGKTSCSIDIANMPIDEVQELVCELQMLADNVPELFAYVGSDQRYRFVNKRYETTFGLPKYQIIGSHIKELLGEPSYSSIKQHIATVLKGKPTSFQTQIGTREGPRWVSIRLTPHWKEKNLSGFYALISDITDQKTAESKLERETSLFESVVRSVPDALMLATLDRVISFCNPGVQRVFGYEPKELVGNPTSILYANPEDYRQQGKIRFHSDAVERFEINEIEFKRKNGERFIGEFVGTIIRKTGEEPIGFLGLIRDISQRRKLELEQHRYFRVLEALSSGMPLAKLLELVVQLAEEARPGMIGSILLLDPENQCLNNGYAANLPRFFNKAIDGINIGPGVGSCGTAAFTGKRVIVEDIFSHDYWRDYRDLAAAANLRSCWSEPILCPEDEILGTLAMYFPEAQSPTESDLDLLEHCAQLAGIAIAKARADERLMTSEERLGLAFRATNDAIWDLNVLDNTVWRNKAYEDQFGGTDGANTSEWWASRIHPNDRERVVASAEAFANGHGDSDRWTIEYRFQREDGSYAVVVDRAWRACDQSGKSIRIIGSLTDMTERRALEKEVLHVAAAENRRIGNDLHDGVGQELTGLSMIANSLVTALSRNSNPELNLAIKIENGIKRTLRQVRALARGMNPVDVDGHGLMSALTEMCQRVSELYEVQCAFVCEEPVILRDNQTATHLYRIAQEAATNAIRHGNAKRITVSLSRKSGSATLNIVDDGIGFDHATQTDSGMGLRIMSYRAGIIGADCKIETSQGGGASVTCTCPEKNE